MPPRAAIFVAQIALVAAFAAVWLLQREGRLRAEDEVRRLEALSTLPTAAEPAAEGAAAPLPDPKPDSTTDPPERKDAEERSGIEPGEEIGELPPDRQRAYADALFDDVVAGSQGIDWLASVLGQMDPAVAAEVLRRRWADVKDPEDRQELIRRLLFMGNPAALEFLDVEIRDPDPNVRTDAVERLWEYAFCDLSDPAAYEKWRERTRGLTLEDALGLSARDLVARLRAMEPGSPDIAALRHSITMLDREAGVALREAGIDDILDRWLAGSNPDDTETALDLLISSDAGPQRIRDAATPLLENPAMRAPALRALGWVHEDGVADVVRPWLMDADPNVVGAAASSLIQLGREADTVRALIDAVGKSACPDVARLLGEYTLRNATGVPWHPSHDAAWWEAWWKEHEAELRAKETK